MMGEMWDKAIYMYLHMYVMCIMFKMSASCTHASALLQALVAATFSDFTIRSTSSASHSEEDLPVISYSCQWKAPKKHKQSTLRFTDSVLKTCMAR